MTLEILLLVVVPALLVAAAIWDLTSYKIPNFLVLALLGSFVIFAGVGAFAGLMSWGNIGSHMLAGTLALFVGLGLFAAGAVGGGDAKLFAATALWLGWNALPEFVILVCLFGGALTMLIIGFRKMPMPALLLRQGWVNGLIDGKAGVPYGVALSAAALAVLPHTQSFRVIAIW